MSFLKPCSRFSKLLVQALERQTDLRVAVPGCCFSCSSKGRCLHSEDVAHPAPGAEAEVFTALQNTDRGSGGFVPASYGTFHAQLTRGVKETAFLWKSKTLLAPRSWNSTCWKFYWDIRKPKPHCVWGDAAPLGISVQNSLMATRKHANQANAPVCRFITFSTGGNNRKLVLKQAQALYFNGLC